MNYFEERPEDRATRSFARKIALRGGQISRSEFVAPWKPACDRPATVGRRIRAGGLDRSIEVQALVPCRKCERCLQIRQCQWKDRALIEIERSKRTWFLTLTFNDIHLAGCKAKATQEVGADPTERLEKACYRDVQKYLKRLRAKFSGLKFRYLAVFELGEKTGRPHYHLLIHEVGQRPVSQRELDNDWPSFINARLVAKAADGAAVYVTKYATKSVIFRIRASGAYGKMTGLSERK